MIPPRPPLDHRRAGRRGVRVTTASQLRRTCSASRSAVVLQERRRGAEAGVVDQQLDVDVRSSRDPGSGRRARVGWRGRSATHVRVGGQLGGKALEAVGPAGDEHHVVPRSASWRANCSPMPEEAPVTRAVSRIGMSPMLLRGVRAQQAQTAAVPARPLEDRVRAWEARVPVGAGDAVVSGDPARARARQPGAHAVSARPRPDRALEGVPAAQAQDAGVHRARGRPLPDPAHAHARDLLHRAHGGAGAGPERGPHRGDRARARPRPPAVRPHRRGGARRGAAGARRRGRLPPQPRTRCASSTCSSATARG